MAGNITPPATPSASSIDGVFGSVSQEANLVSGAFADLFNGTTALGAGFGTLGAAPLVIAKTVAGIAGIGAAGVGAAASLALVGAAAGPVGLAFAGIGALGIAGTAVASSLVAVAAGGLATVAALKPFAAAASPDGLKFFGDAINILVGTIGIALVPGFVMVGAMALTVAQSIGQFYDEHKNAITSWWASWLPVAEDGIDRLMDFGDTVLRVGGIISAFAPVVGSAFSTILNMLQSHLAIFVSAIGDLISNIPGLGSTGRSMMDAAANMSPDSPGKGGIMDTVLGRGADYESNVDKRKKQRDAEKNFMGPPDPNRPESSFLKNQRTLVDAMKSPFSGRVGYGDVADARDRIQEQNLQTDLSRELLKVQQSALKVAEDTLDVQRRSKSMVGA